MTTQLVELSMTPVCLPDDDVRFEFDPQFKPPVGHLVFYRVLTWGRANRIFETRIESGIESGNRFRI